MHYIGLSLVWHWLQQHFFPLCQFVCAWLCGPAEPLLVSCHFSSVQLHRPSALALGGFLVCVCVCVWRVCVCVWGACVCVCVWGVCVCVCVWCVCVCVSVNCIACTLEYVCVCVYVCRVCVCVCVYGIFLMAPQYRRLCIYK